MSTEKPIDAQMSADALYRDIQRLEHSGRQALLFTQQAKQDVLGADVVVLESPRLFLGQDDNLAGSLCESLEHKSLLLTVVIGRRSGRFSWLSLSYAAKLVKGKPAMGTPMTPFFPCSRLGRRI